MDIVEKTLDKDVVIDSFIIPGDNWNHLFQLRHDGRYGAFIMKFPLLKEGNRPFSMNIDIKKIFLTKFVASLYWNHLKNKHKDKIIVEGEKE